MKAPYHYPELFASKLIRNAVGVGLITASATLWLLTFDRYFSDDDGHFQYPLPDPAEIMSGLDTDTPAIAPARNPEQLIRQTSTGESTGETS